MHVSPPPTALLPISLRYRSYLHVLKEKALPWLKSASSQPLFLIEPPIRPPAGVQPLPIAYRLPRAPRNSPSTQRQHRWFQEGLETMRFVEIGCVLEGVADYVYGIEADDAYDVTGVALPERTFFIVPPEVARPDGSRPHRERPDTRASRIRIFWLLFLPSGVSGHVCTSEGPRHISHERFFVRDSLMEPLVTALLEALRDGTPDAALAARGVLFTILVRVVRALEGGQFVASGIDQAAAETGPAGLSPVARLACHYIQAHLHQPLSLPTIASQCHVSPSHLSRCFRKELGESVMNYVAHRRIDAAVQLLTNPDLADLSIQAISSMVGFASPEYFTRTFSQRLNVSPTRYRQSQGATVNVV